MIDKRNTLSTRQVKYLETWKQAKDRLHQAIDGLDPDVISKEIIHGDWTVKDLIGHIISWNVEFRSNIQTILDGQHPGYDHQISEENNYSNWNQHWIEQKRDWPLDRTLADLEDDYNEAVELIKRLQPEDYRKRGITPWKHSADDPPQTPTKKNTDSIETLVTYHWRHMFHHTKEIEEWRKIQQK